MKSTADFWIVLSLSFVVSFFPYFSPLKSLLAAIELPQETFPYVLVLYQMIGVFIMYDKNIKSFGITTSGEEVFLVTLENTFCSCEILTYGAAIRSLLVPDQAGNPIDVVLG